ncbi:MAG: TIGR02996 domain-containing protein [Myxococcaceae bacterium]
MDDAEFLEAIVSRPDDDAPRAVYADWLTEQGRPEGEFIALQLARSKRRSKATPRETSLFTAHREKLLGPFARVFAKGSVRFHRGFPVAARTTDELPKHVLTRLLEEVHFGAGFEKGCRLDQLRRAVGPDTVQRDRLPSIAPRLEDWDVDTDEWDSLTRALGKTELERLALRLGIDRGAALSRLFALPSLVGLKNLELRCATGNAGRLRLQDAPTGLVRVDVETPPVRVHLVKGPRGWAARVSIHSLATLDELNRQLLELVAASQEQIVRVSIDARRTAHAVAAKALLETFFSDVRAVARAR